MLKLESQVTRMVACFTKTMHVHVVLFTQDGQLILKWKAKTKKKNYKNTKKYKKNTKMKTQKKKKI